MKKFSVLLIVMSLVSVCYAVDAGLGVDIPASAFAPGASTPMSTKIMNSAGLGFMNSGGTSTSVFRYNPDFTFGNISLGLDINIPVQNQAALGLDSVVLRYVEYKSPKWGAKYGILNNVTMGYGLLVDNYSTAASGGILPANNRTGVKAYFNQDIYGIEGMATWSKIYAARVTEQPVPYLTLGQYYITDTDGVNYVKPTGTAVMYPGQSGYGLDAGMPLWGNSLIYAEYAKIVNHGGGFSAGFSTRQNLIIADFSFKAEKRYIEYNFVPGYFNENYETDPIDLASYEASAQTKDGYRVVLTGNVLNKGSFWALLEGYNGSNGALKAEASAQLTPEYFVAAGFYQPNFVDSRSLDLAQGAIITGKAGYKLNPFTNVIANYKKAYDSTLGKVVETQWYELSFNF